MNYITRAQSKEILTDASLEVSSESNPVSSLSFSLCHSTMERLRPERFKSLSLPSYL